MDPDNIEKLIHAANFIVRVNDAENRGDLQMALNIVLRALSKDVSLRFEAGNRQYRMTNGQGDSLDKPFDVKSEPEVTALVISLLNYIPPKCQIAALVHLTTLRLDEKIIDQ
jgi:hypothetical protein